MISQEIIDFIMPNIEDYIVPLDNVAHVIDEHSLLNALIILSNERYTTIPVLNVDNKLKGLINTATIIQNIIHQEGMDFDKLYTKRISDIDLPKAVTIRTDESFEVILDKLVKENFLCVLDEKNRFVGILTRRTLMIQINRLLHNESLGFK